MLSDIRQKYGQLFRRVCAESETFFYFRSKITNELSVLVLCRLSSLVDSTFRCTAFIHQGPNLQNILRQSYDYLTIMPKLRSTYDRRLIHKTSYEGRKVFLGYNSLAKS